MQRCYGSQRFLKICKPLVYCMALFHSQTQRHVIKKRITESDKQSSNLKHMLRLNKMFQRKKCKYFFTHRFEHTFWCSKELSGSNYSFENPRQWHTLSSHW